MKSIRVGAYLVTAAVLVVYVAHYLGLVNNLIWTDGDMRLQDVCLSLVIGYWLGSSDGSSQKSDILHEQNKEIRHDQ